VGSTTTNGNGDATFTGLCDTHVGDQTWTAHFGSLSAMTSVHCTEGEVAGVVLSMVPEHVFAGDGVVARLETQDQYQNQTNLGQKLLTFSSRDANTGVDGTSLGDLLPESFTPHQAVSSVQFTFSSTGTRVISVNGPGFSAEAMLTIDPPPPPNGPPTIFIHQVEPEERELADGDTVTVDEGTKIQIQIRAMDDDTLPQLTRRFVSHPVRRKLR
jgi:hypothetical protein